MRKTVLIVGNLSSVGGVEYHCTELSLLLREQGADVTLASFSDDWFRLNGDILRAAGVRLLSTGLPYSASPMKKRLKAFATWPFALPLRSYDVALGIGTGTTSYLLRWALKPDGFLIYNWASWVDKNAIRRTVQANRLAMRMADGVTGLTPTACRLMELHFGRHSSIRPLAHFTCVRQKLPAVPDRVTRTADQPVRLGFFGRMDPSKNPGLLVDIFPTLNIGDVTLDFYGAGPLESGIRARVQALGLERYIRVHGAYDRASQPELLANTDIVVSPCPVEGLGLVLLEGMAHGKPFVATSNGGPADIATTSPFVRAVSTEAGPFAAAIRELASLLRSGTISPSQLQKAYREHYSYEILAPLWTQALLEPHRFWK